LEERWAPASEELSVGTDEQSVGTTAGEVESSASLLQRKTLPDGEARLLEARDAPSTGRSSTTPESREFERCMNRPDAREKERSALANVESRENEPSRAASEARDGLRYDSDCGVHGRTSTDTLGRWPLETDRPVWFGEAPGRMNEARTCSAGLRSVPGVIFCSESVERCRPSRDEANDLIERKERTELDERMDCDDASDTASMSCCSVARCRKRSNMLLPRRRGMSR
jgi:hypothetical protein